MKKILLALCAISAFFTTFALNVYAAPNNASIILKENASGLVDFTIKDPDGILEFSFMPSGKSPYGGTLSGCLGTFTHTDTAFVSPIDFTPSMKATIIDCKNNTTEFEIPPMINKTTRGKIITKEEATPSPAPAPAQEETKEKTQKEKTLADVRYPVKELGDCQNKKECLTYCDAAIHAKECFAFAKKYNLLSEKEAKDAADKFLNVTNGPGGCNSGASCEQYCNSTDHLDECISFGEKHNYLSGEQLKEAKKIQRLVKANKKFPGGCKNRNSCELYCNDTAHIDECLAFAEENDMIPKDELEQAKKVKEFIKRGETPGKCTSKESCESYCLADEHADECIAFAQKAGLVSEEDAAIIKKTGGKGPGGCHSKNQCELYCKDHQEECFAWAKDNGLMNEKDMQRMQQGMKQFKEHLDKMPPEVMQCLKNQVGEDNFNILREGKPIFDRTLEAKMKSCFAKMTTQMNEQFSKMPPEVMQCVKGAIGEEAFQKMQQGEFTDNANFEGMEACFQKMREQMGGGEHGDEQGGFPGAESGGHFSGPGGCKSREECEAYCRNHLEECQKFGAGNMMRGASPNEEEAAGNYANSDGCTRTGDHAAFVCAINGKGAEPDKETTYFNACTAKNHGATILHEGVCKDHAPCAEVADIVCSTENRTWTHACYAKEMEEVIAHKGACRGMGTATPPREGSGGHFSGPGGCKSREECEAYCRNHLEECQKYAPSGSTQYPQQYQQQIHEGADQCAKYGGTWDGTTCNLPSSTMPSSGTNLSATLCSKYGGTWDGTHCNMPNQQQQYPPQDQQYPQASGSYDIPITPEICGNFSNVPVCSYVGSTDSQNYQLCKKCYPDK